MKIGFTGTQRGMTDYQQEQVRNLLTTYRKGLLEIHHGGCIGADAQFHDMCHSMMLVTPTIHPASDVDAKLKAELDYAIVRYAKPALERNHDIVDSVDVMIAIPAQRRETLRSGTWATIRYAKKVGRVIHILYPI